MKYAVDRVEGNTIVLENIETKEIREIDKNKLNYEVDDGDILFYKNNKYYRDEKTKRDRLKIIQEKLDRLKK